MKRLCSCSLKRYRGLIGISDHWLWLALGTSIAGALSFGVQANPQGGQVTAGQASITQTSPSRLDVLQRSDKAVIDWRSFDIGAGQHTHFQQPGKRSIALNRVKAGGQSAIDGKLTANGQIFLINPNGVVFGEGAQVNVAGLIATSNDIKNDAFMAGRYDFDTPGNSGSTITNKGRISIAEGGMAAFVAPGVENAGVIQARLGRVALASGDRFTVDLYGDNLVKLAVDDQMTDQIAGSDGKPLGALVGNSGEIIADGGTVALTANTARGVVDQVINMDGVVRAQSIEMADGKIVLNGGERGVVTVSGTLDASGKDPGEQGGMVKVLGEKVALLDEARIDVAGATGGGAALVGGNYQGKGPEANATAAYVGPQTQITADALAEGDGGSVVVWSDDATRFHGEITARGGPLGGDGGLVETSSKHDLLVEHASIRANADKGQPGTWLVDPVDFTINAGEAATISSTLSSGTNYVNNTSGKLTVAAPIRTTETAGPLAVPTLRLNSGGDLIVNASIMSNQPADQSKVHPFKVDLDAGGNIELNRRIQPGNFFLAGAVTINAGRSVTVSDTVSTYAIDVVAGGDVVVDSTGRLNAGSHSLKIESGGNFVNSGTLDVIRGGGINITSNSVTNELTGKISAESDIELIADKFELAVKVEDFNVVDKSSLTTDKTVAFRPRTAGLRIHLPSQDFLDRAELETIVANTIEIGSESAGNIVTGDAFLGVLGGTDVVFVSGGDVSYGQNPFNKYSHDSGLGIIARTISGAPAIGSLLVNVKRFAAQLTGNGAGLSLVNAHSSESLDVGAVGRVSGVTTNNGIVEIKTSGDLKVSQSINAGNTDVLLDALNGAVNQTGGAITARGLAVVADSAELLGENNAIDQLAANIRGKGNSLIYTDVDGLTVASVRRRSGIRTEDGVVSLFTRSGDLELASDINVGEADVSLTALAGTVNQAGGSITAEGVAVVAESAELSGKSNDIDRLAATITGTRTPFTYNNAEGLEIGTVGTISGITTTDGSVNVTAETGDLGIAADVVAEMGDVSLSALVGGVNQTGGLIRAEGLAVRANNASLAGTNNQIDRLAGVITGSGTPFSYTDSDGIEIGTVGTNSGVTTNDGSITVVTETGDLGIAANVVAGTGDVSFSALAGSVNQSGGFIHAGGLAVSANTASLAGTNNQIDRLVAKITGPGAPFSYTDTNELEIGTVGSISGITTTDGSVTVATETGDLGITADLVAGTGDVSLSAQTGAVNQTGGLIRAEGLAVSANTASLTGTNNQIDRLAAAIAGSGTPFSYTDTDGLEIGTVGLTSGITTNDGSVTVATETGDLGIAADIVAGTDDVSLSALAGAVNQSAGLIHAAGLGVRANTSSLAGASNQIDRLAAAITGSGTPFRYTNTNGLEISTVGSISGVTTNDGSVTVATETGDLGIAADVVAGTGDVSLSALAGGVNQSGGLIRAEGLAVSAKTATLAGASNQIDRLAAVITGSGTPFSYTDADRLEIGTVGLTSGITTNDGSVTVATETGDLGIAADVVAGTGDVSLSALGGAVNQTGGLFRAEGLAVRANTASLTGTSNQIDRLAAAFTGSGTSFSYTDTNGLEIGTVGTTSGITTNSGAVALVTQSGDLNITADINARQAEVALTASLGALNQSGGAITASGLAVVAESAQLLGAGNTVDRLAARLTGVNNSFDYASAGGFEVGAVATVHGVETLDGEVNLQADGGALTLSEVIFTGSGDITLSASDFDSKARPDMLRSSGTLTLQPMVADAAIGVGGGAGDFNLSESDLASIADGFASIIIGREDGTHSIDLGNTRFTDPVILRAPAAGGTIAVTGRIEGMDDAAITLAGPGATTTLAGDIITDGNPILIDDNVILAADVRLDTTNAGSATGNDITVTGPITGGQALTLTAGVGEVSLLATSEDPVALTQFTASASDVNVQSIAARDILLEDSGSVTGAFNAEVSLSLFDVPAFDISATVAGLEGADAMCAATVFPATGAQFINGLQVPPITVDALANTLNYLNSLAVPGRPIELMPANPAAAAFAGDPAKGGYSVTIFTDDYTLIHEEESPDPIFEDLPYIRDGFWEGLLGIRR